MRSTLAVDWLGEIMLRFKGEGIRIQLFDALTRHISMRYALTVRPGNGAQEAER